MVDGANDLILASDGDWRTLDVFTPDPAFVVHPPLGKWTIALGEYVFGATPFGWRFAVAVLGTLSILMVARITRRLTRSDLIGTLAGLLLAVEGMHLVMSRTGLLDMVLMFWVLAAFGLLLIDRDRTRRRLADLVPRDGLGGTQHDLGAAPGRASAGAGPPPSPSGSRAASSGRACGSSPSSSSCRSSGTCRPAARSASAGPGWPRSCATHRPPACRWWPSPSWCTCDVDRVAAHRRRLRPRLGGRAARLVRPGGTALAVALPRGGMAVPRRTEHRPPVCEQPAVVAVPGPSDVVLLRGHQGRQPGCPTDNCSTAVTALGNPHHLVVRHPRRHPPGLALDRPARLALGRGPGRHRRGLVPVAALPRPHDLHLLHGRLRAVRRDGRRDDASGRSSVRRTHRPQATRRCRRRGGGRLSLVVVVAWWFYPIWSAEVIPYEAWRLRMWFSTWV